MIPSSRSIIECRVPGHLSWQGRWQEGGLPLGWGPCAAGPGLAVGSSLVRLQSLLVTVRAEVRVQSSQQFVRRLLSLCVPAQGPCQRQGTVGVWPFPGSPFCPIVSVCFYARTILF